MDNSFHRQGPGANPQQPRGRLANSLRIFESILHWLYTLIQLTKEEQQDAGIYLGHLGDE